VQSTASNALRFLFFLLLGAVCAAPVAADQESAADSRLAIDHLFELGSVSDPQISPDGDWIPAGR